MSTFRLFQIAWMVITASLLWSINNNIFWMSHDCIWNTARILDNTSEIAKRNDEFYKKLIEETSTR